MKIIKLKNALALILIIACILSSCSEVSDNITVNPSEVEAETKPKSNESETKVASEPTPTESEYNIHTYDLEIIELDISQYITWPDIYDDYAVFSNYNFVTNERREIHLFNIVTKEDEIIYSAKDREYDSMIEDVRIGDGWVFWIEGHWTSESMPVDWTIKAYNIHDKKIQVIRESADIEGTITLVPRIDNENNTIVWLEGYTDSLNNLVHEIYSYNVDNDTINKVSDVSHVENPYTIIELRNNVICFSDYIDNSWVLRIISLESGEETVIETNSYPQNPCSDGDIVIWGEGTKKLYYMDLDNKEKILIEEKSFLYDIHNGNIYYTTSREKHHVYKYNIKDGNISCLTKSVEDEYKHIWFDFINFYGEKMVCVFNRKIYDENGDIKDSKYVLTIVHGID